MSVLIDLVHCNLIVMTALVIGYRALNLLKGNIEDRLEKLVFALALGLGFLSLTVFFLGIAGFLYRWVFYALFILTLFSSIDEIKAIVSDFFRLDISFNVFFWICTIFILVGLVEAFSPVISWDSLAYHLAIPKIYLSEHRILSIPSMPPSYWPQAIDMLYLIGLSLRGESLAQLISLTLTVTMTGAVYILARHYFSRRIAVFSVLVFISVPLVNLYYSITYADIGLALFITLSIFAFLNNKFYLAAILSGFALTAKLSGLMILPLWLVGIIWRRSLVKELIKPLVFMLLLGSIWYLRSWLATGNPVYPFVYQLFGGTNWNALSARLYNELLAGVRVENFLDFIKMPLDWTMGKREASIGILLLPLTTAGLICFKSLPIAVRRLLMISGLLFLCFGVISTQARFNLALLAILSIISGYMINHIWPKGKIMGTVILMMVVILTFGWGLKTKQDKLLVAIGRIDRQAYLTASTPFYHQIQWINDNLPDSSRILMSSIHSYYLNKKYVWGIPPVAGLLDFSEIKTGKEFLDRVEELEITHLFFVPKERITSSVMGDFLDKIYQEASEDGRLVLVKEWVRPELLAWNQEIKTALYRFKD